MVAWVSAVEETDPDGTVLSSSDRLEATRAAGGEEERGAFLAKRAEILRVHLNGEWVVPATPGVPGWAKAVLIGGALVGGVAVDRLDGGQDINVLAFPLMGLLLWNLLLYLLMVVGCLRGGGAGQGMLARVVEKTCRGAGGEVRQRFFGLWWPMAAGKEIAGLRLVLHLAAGAAALGVVGGMYWRGLATEYRAVWESTFLSAEVAGTFLGVVLWPASAISGAGVPEIGGAVFSREETASWIHLFAVTAGLVIVVPRVVLAGVLGIRVKRMGRRMLSYGDSWAGYEEGLRNQLRGGATVVDVVAFASELQNRGRSAVRGYVVARWGGGAVVEFGDVVGYGDEDAFLGKCGSMLGGVTVVVFQLTATPEDEVQGQFMREIRARRPGEVIMLIDGRGFEERFGAMAEYRRRVEERRSAWRTVIRGDGFETVMLGEEG